MLIKTLNLMSFINAASYNLKLYKIIPRINLIYLIIWAWESFKLLFVKLKIAAIK